MKAAKLSWPACSLGISSWRSTGRTQRKCSTWRPRTRSRTPRHSCCSSSKGELMRKVHLWRRSCDSRSIDSKWMREPRSPVLTLRLLIALSAFLWHSCPALPYPLALPYLCTYWHLGLLPFFSLFFFFPPPSPLQTISTLHQTPSPSQIGLGFQERLIIVSVLKGDTSSPPPRMLCHATLLGSPALMPSGVVSFRIYVHALVLLALMHEVYIVGFNWRLPSAAEMPSATAEVGSNG